MAQSTALLHTRTVLDVRRLRLLHELHRRGTIAAVAKALHFSPSAVSQQLAVLEAEAGARLVERVGRGVRLTAAGLRLAEDAEAVLTRLEEAEARLAALGDEPAGTVRVAAFQTALLALLPPALAALAAHPRLRVEIVQAEPEQALPALLAHDVDLLVGEEYPGEPAARSSATHREELWDDPLRVAGGELDALADRAWVMEPPGSAARRWALARCRAAGFEPDVRHESADLLVHVALVAHGHAAAFLPDLVWVGRPPEVPVHALPGQTRRLFTLVRRGAADHPAVRAVRASLRSRDPRNVSPPTGVV
jgi:DNA-binding transcriptional LysR family regulator